MTPKGHWMAAAEQSCSACWSLEGCGGTILFSQRLMGWLRRNKPVQSVPPKGPWMAAAEQRKASKMRRFLLLVATLFATGGTLFATGGDPVTGSKKRRYR